MMLREAAVKRLFERLAAHYTTEWMRQFDAVPEEDVERVWQYELSGFDRKMWAISWAIENLPERCPNASVFRNLCRQAPEPVKQMLPAPAVTPEQIAKAVGEVGQARQLLQAPKDGKKGWARKILEQHEAGLKKSPTILRFAREALRK